MIGGNDKRWQKSSRSDPSDDWLMSYADMITVLFGFFVMLSAISRPDSALYEQVKSSIVREVGKRDTESPLTDMKQQLKDIAVQLNIENSVSVGTDPQGIYIDLDAAILFKTTTTELQDTAGPVLKKLAETLNNPSYSAFQVEVQGHTDDNPAAPPFQSNWDYSAARAGSVARALVHDGVTPTRLKASGFADIAPRAVNRNNGVPQPANQALNRRVVVRIHPR